MVVFSIALFWMVLCFCFMVGFTDYDYKRSKFWDIYWGWVAGLSIITNAIYMLYFY